MPEDVMVAHPEDMYWNIPTIHHRFRSEQEEVLAKTILGLSNVFSACVEKGMDKVASFTLTWDRHDGIRVSVSVLGHSRVLLAWLNENNNIPLKKDQFKKWTEKQNEFINRYPIKHDTPPLFEMVCSDGVLFIKRRGIDPDIYKLKANDEGRLTMELSIPKDQFELVTAYKRGALDSACTFLHKQSICSDCQGDYYKCNHSKWLDPNVVQKLKDSELLAITCTDRKA
ncbi:MAG: hypothetical protein Salg2KO_14860 [Salibacteraceae bacterium]